MRILMLGAGAIGGYFGGRLAQADADVTFLVRDRRAAQLGDKGLVVRSPHGDFHVHPQWIVEADSLPPFDLVILTCKAFDLDAAIRAIQPAVGPGSHVLPLLNGIVHLDRLAEAFGEQRVLGGSCAIPATLSPEGEVTQLNPLHRIVFGVLPGTGFDASAKVQALAASFARTPVDVVVAPDVLLVSKRRCCAILTQAMQPKPAKSLATCSIEPSPQTSSLQGCGRPGVICRSTSSGAKDATRVLERLPLR